LPSTLTIAALRGKVLKEKVLILSERFLIFSPISDSVELAGIPLETGKSHAIYGSCPNPKVKEMLLLTSPRSRAILGPLDILVDIGVPAEKEVIQ